MQTTGASTLVEQCRRIKAVCVRLPECSPCCTVFTRVDPLLSFLARVQVDPTSKCFVYRNTELALEWLEPQVFALCFRELHVVLVVYRPLHHSPAAHGDVRPSEH